MENEQKQHLLLSEEISDQEDIPRSPRDLRPWCSRNPFVLVVLIISLGINAVLLYGHTVGQNSNSPDNLGLAEAGSQNMQRWHSTVYSHPNETLRDQAWHNIDIDRAIVAVDHREAAALGLPATRTFPWDSGKGVYALNVYHQFHCLKLLYTTLQESRHGKSWSNEYEHLLHCLDSLRGDLECTADDHLFYINDKNDPPTGEGQIVQCKDFAKLDEWAMEHHACYKYNEAGDARPASEILQWRNCPGDSKYASKMREYFGYDEDWVPDFPSNHNREFTGGVHEKAEAGGY